MPPQIADAAASYLISAAYASPNCRFEPLLLLMMPLIADASAFQPSILVCFPSVLLYIVDLDALCRLKLPTQPPLASLLLLMPRPIADSSPFLLLIVPLIADPAAFLLLILPLIADSAASLLLILPLFADSDASLLLILPLIAHSIAFLLLMPHLVPDSSAASDCKVRALLAAVIKPHGGAGRSSRSAGYNPPTGRRVREVLSKVHRCRN